MIYRTKKEVIDAYFLSERVSQSQLKLFLGGVDKFITEREKANQRDDYDEPAEHFIIGSAVDCILTEGDEVFKQRYYVSTIVKKPSDTVSAIVKQVFDMVTAELPVVSNQTVGNVVNYRDMILQVCAEREYQPRYGDDAKLNALVRENAGDYWDELVSAQGRQILTFEQNNVIRAVADSFKTHENFRFYFDEQANLTSNVDVLFQVPFFVTIDGIQVKGLLDMIIIDYERHTIKIGDIKTMRDTVVNFPRQVRKRRYDIQVAFYQKLVKHVRNNGLLVTMLTDFYGDDVHPAARLRGIGSFGLVNPCFFVQSTVYSNTPVCYTVTNDLLEMGIKGRIGKIPFADSGEFYAFDIEPILGYVQLIDAYKRYSNGYITHPPLMTLDWNISKIE